LFIAVTTTFVACEPYVVSEGVGKIVTSVDEIQATVTQVVENGKNTNKVNLACTSPVLCQWTDGVNLVNANEGEMLLTEGQHTVVLTALAAEGNKFTKNFPVTVDEIAYPVPPEYAYFCGTGEKIWTWVEAPAVCWGLGTEMDVSPMSGYGYPVVAALPNPSVYLYCVYLPTMNYALSQESLDPESMNYATMKFELDGMKLSKKDVYGTELSSGRFSFNMNEQKKSGAISTLTLTNTNMLFGYDIGFVAGITDAPPLAPWTEYHIMSLNATTMVLSARSHGSAPYYYFWVFRAL
jgi:hypothetical protein